jgi:uncharacterized protein YcbK (DUF882 family)
MYKIPQDMKLSKNFSLSEFVCKDGSSEVIVDYRLIEGLQKLRDKLGRIMEITPNGGYRTKKWNEKCGGIDTSEHIEGKAGDLKVAGLSPFDVAYVADSLKVFSGIGVYPTFTHVDVGDWKGYWRQDAKGKKTFYKTLAELKAHIK